MFRIVVIDDGSLNGSVVVREVAALLESLKMSVDCIGIENSCEYEQHKLRGEKAVVLLVK